MNQDDGKFLLAAIQDMPVFVLYHSIVLIFNNFNWSIWFNNSKKVSFSVSGSVTKSGCSSVFFKVFFIDTPVETYSYSFGRENNFPFSVSIQQDFISFLNVQIDRQKKIQTLSVLNVGQHSMWRILHIDLNLK